MKSINIEYQPVRFLKRKRSVTATIPEQWKEIDSGQLIALARANQDDISNVDFIQAFTGIKKAVIKKLDLYQQFKIIEQIGFVNTISPHNTFILDKIIIGESIFTGPKPMLKGMSFGQFIFVDSHFRNYNETSNPEELNRFLAALYLPEKKKFREKIIEKNYGLFSKADPAVKTAALLNYIIVFEWIMDLYPLVFPRPYEPEKEKPEKKESKRDPRSWIKIFDNLVGDDIVNQDQYAKLPFHSVFRYFTKNIKEHMKSKK